MISREQQLQKNFSRMFWVKALLNAKAYNVVASLFYIQRGLHVSEIFYLAIIWSITSLISEVPSSYLADRWGRKKTILLGVGFSFVHWMILSSADSFLWFGVSFFFYSLSFSMISGTDEALVYDTHKELQGNESALARLGRLASAERLFKIFTVLFAGFIAKDLAPWQFTILICIDIGATICSFFFAIRLVEPAHTMDLERMESGVLADGIEMLRQNLFIRRVVFSKTLLFIASFIPWRFQDVFFTGMGIPVLWFAVCWAIYQAAGYILVSRIKWILPNLTLNARINRMNRVGLVFLVLFLICWKVFPMAYLLLFLYICFELSLILTHPWYSKIFHLESASFNRATTISLTNFLKGLFEIPLLGMAAFFAGFDQIFPYYFACGIVCITLLFFSLPKWKESN